MFFADLDMHVRDVIEQNFFKPKFHESSFLAGILVTSSPTRPTRRHPREDLRKDVGVSGDFPVQLATRLPLLCCGVLLPVCPCVVSFSKFHEHDTHDVLRTSSRGCYEENAPVEFRLHSVEYD